MHKILLLHKHNEVFEAGYTMDIDLNVKKGQYFSVQLWNLQIILVLFSISNIMVHRFGCCYMP